MALRITRSLVLDVATAGLVVVAGAILAHDRLLPALAEQRRLDPGDQVDDDLRFRRVGTNDTVGIGNDEASLIVVFKSTCPVCEQTAPAWAALARLAPHRVFPVGLEEDSTASAWVARRLARIRPVRPLDPARFLDRLRIRAVPTTLLFEGRRLTLARIGPLRAEDVALIRRALLGRRVVETKRSVHPPTGRLP